MRQKKKNWSGLVIGNIIIDREFCVIVKIFFFYAGLHIKEAACENARGLFCNPFSRDSYYDSEPRKSVRRRFVWCVSGDFLQEHTTQKRGRLMMYRNNFRPPQMGQSRPNMSFGNWGCGMQRTYPQSGNNCCEPGCCTPPDNDCCEPVCCTPPDNDCCEPQPPDNDCCCKNNKPDPDCVPSKKDPIAGMALAMAYVPWQDYKNICPEEEAWCKGTIFAQLDLDFMARRCN